MLLHFSSAYNHNLLVNDDTVVSYHRSVESLGDGLGGDVVYHLIITESKISAVPLGLFDPMLRDHDVGTIKDDLVAQTEANIINL